MTSSSACPSSECSSSTETADPLCSTSRCCQSLAVFSAHLGPVCVGSESMCVFPFVRQMEGHRHHSAQQVGHHRGDNQQRRHYHFSHGECFVWSLHTHTGTLTHGWEEKHSDISVTITFQMSIFPSPCFYLQEDMEMAKYIARLFTARHKFYKQNKIFAE